MAPENWLYYYFFGWKDPADTIILPKVSPIFFRAFQSFASTKSFAMFIIFLRIYNFTRSSSRSFNMINFPNQIRMIEIRPTSLFEHDVGRTFVR